MQQIEKAEKVKPLKDAYKGKFLVGTILGIAALQGKSRQDTELATTHFNAITPENSLKPEAVQPREGEFRFAEGDMLVAMTEQAAGLLGSPLLVPESDKFLHNQRLGLVTKKPGTAWTNEFFFHVFNTQPVRTEIHASASGVKNHVCGKTSALNR